MALQTQVTFDSGVTANEAYTMITQAQINKLINCVEAEVSVYYDQAARLAGYSPLKQFKHAIYDNYIAQQDTRLSFAIVRPGEIAIKNGEVVLVNLEIAEEDMHIEHWLENIADQLQHTSLDVAVENYTIVVKAKDDLAGAAGSELDVVGEGIALIERLVGNDASPSDLDVFTPDALSAEGVNIIKQIYEHIKAKDPRYADAIDV